MVDKLAELVPEGTYHIYNRANGNERIFLTSENYRFFKMKFDLYISPVAEVYCYCLMPNHFHYLVRIRSEKDIDNALGAQKREKYGFEKLISKQFSNLFSCYTQAFNKQQKRMGSLFIKNFKRKKVTDDAYFRNLVSYIHRNPLEAGLCVKLEDYKYSSYGAIIGRNSDMSLGSELISSFEDLNNFIQFHKKEEECEKLGNIIFGDLR